MITREWIIPPERDFLSQGDVVAGCFIRQPAQSLRFLQRVNRPDPNRPDRPDHRSSDTPPTNDHRQLIVAEAQRVDVIVMSYACDIDKVLARIANGEPAIPSEVCFVAPLFERRNYQRVLDVIDQGRMENAVPVAESEHYRAGVIDFAYMQTVNMRYLLTRVSAGRVCSLAGAGRTVLLQRFARFFGSKERIDAAAFAQDDNTLLRRSLETLGLPFP